MKWELDSDGGADLTLATFEWSKNFANRAEPIGKKIISLTLNNRRILNNNETYFESLRLPNDSYIRVQVANNIGASPKSEPYKLNSEPVKAQVNNNNNNNERRPKICPLWLVVLVLTILLVIAVLSYIVYQVKFKNMSRQNSPMSTRRQIDEERRNFIIN